MLHPDSMALGTDTWDNVRRNRLYKRDDLPFVAANLKLVQTLKPRIIIGIHEDYSLEARHIPGCRIDQPGGFYVYEYVGLNYLPLLSQTHPLFDQIQALGVDRFTGIDDPDPKLNNPIVNGYILFTDNPKDGSFEVRAVYDPAFATTHAFILELPMHCPLELKIKIVKTFLSHFLVRPNTKIFL